MKTVTFIVEAAKYYVGYTEKKGNKGFTNASFEKELKSVGWYVGAPWCAFFVRLILVKAYRNNPELLAKVKTLMSGSTQLSYNAFVNDGTFTVDDTPAVGAIVIWQHGDSTSGHTGIVQSFDLATNTMSVIEGNTNASGSREGDRVAVKLRTVNRSVRDAGLNLKGFIHPLEA
ncbi:CHAP domain-containing protein [Pedobacter arcticus]|uniref:CHAP domain-containing protein n=1 Tax=Pedobacter arcticus TaxID=752140 RepID=UPI0002F515D0|nr:CHAP domain-containing protein [Pedobacter arcticus]